MGRTIRFSIAGLMGIVLVAAIGLAAWRNASETWAGVMLLLTCGVLALAVVGVVCRTEAERAWWLGFALFGWGYLALVFWSWNNDRAPKLPTLVWLDRLSIKLGVNPHGMGGMGGMGGVGGGMRSMPMVTGGFGGGDASGADAYGSHAQVGHCVWALLFAMLGGILARVLFAIPARRSETRGNEGDATSRPGWKRWSRPAAVAVAGLALLAMLGAVRSRSGPGLWAGATFLVTCGLLGLTALGAVLDRGRRGEVWLGATLFGAIYMILAFGRNPIPYPMPHLPTDQFLVALKPWLPQAAQGFFVSSENVAAANARILKALDEPVPMHFRDEATLEDVVKHVQAAITGPDGKVIPIYLDPIGLQEADKSPQAVVSLDIDGVPLKSTLYLCLKQLDLAYCIRDGVLVITSEESQESGPVVYEDPFLIGGHCVLTLLAAVLGGVLAPLVSDSRRESR
ncbi:MAG: hypothetical protein ACLQVF_46555 [Isosphaeraceae bacterium]